ncbi:MAG TPA: tRNA (guanosine(46)-N7)-methyltransferase TrmB, partial [Pseudobacillus sp.]
MRLRNKPWAREKIEAYPQYIVPNPEDHKGNWKKVFNNDNPLYIEVGTGKGQFVTEMAKAHPNVNFIGIELYESVVVTA